MRGRRYSIDGEQNIASPDDSLLGLTTGGTDNEPGIYMWSLGVDDTPADAAIEWYWQRYTAAGTATSVTPQNLGPGTTASASSAGAPEDVSGVAGFGAGNCQHCRADKGKPAERRGRKATGLKTPRHAASRTAGLPDESRRSRRVRAFPPATSSAPVRPDAEHGKSRNAPAADCTWICPGPGPGLRPGHARARRGGGCRHCRPAGP